MTAYVVATHEPPTIVCPPWCVVSTEEHITDLEAWEGMVLHWSSDRVLVPGFTARIALTATPAGSADPDDPLSIHVYGMPERMRPEDARAAGEALMALAAEAQS